MEPKCLAPSDIYPKFRRFDRVTHKDGTHTTGVVVSLSLNPIMQEYNYVVEWDGSSHRYNVIESNLSNEDAAVEIITRRINGLIDELRDIDPAGAPEDNHDLGPIIGWTRSQVPLCKGFVRCADRLTDLINLRTAILTRS